VSNTGRYRFMSPGDSGIPGGSGGSGIGHCNQGDEYEYVLGSELVTTMDLCSSVLMLM
jgi:hypothetical protein